MCGITGFNWKDKKLLQKATAIMNYRGPDQQGFYVNKHISLGHQRLSIIDLSEKGRQPIGNNDKTVFVVFNGEIYNFRALREKLSEKYDFKSESDTEVIVRAYEAFGTDCFRHFNGMWAICIYDKKKQQLILSRDRLGEKPLYYYFDGKKFIFASELKAILQHNIKKIINPDAIDFYLSAGFIPSPHSIYKNIFKVEPRQTVVFDLVKRSIAKKYYYEIPRYSPLYDWKKLVHEGKALLRDAVKLRMVADVPVGAFLSGGIDSSSIVSAMSEFTELRKLHTFSIGFEGRYDETSFIKIMARYAGTINNHNYFNKQDFEAAIDKFSYHCDEPYLDYAGFPMLKLSEAASKEVKVVLSGDGGDEIFGGYLMHRLAVMLQIMNRIPVWLRKTIYNILPNILSSSFYGKFRKIINLSLFPPEQLYSRIHSELVYVSEVFKKWSSEKMQEVLKSCNNNLAEAAIRYDLFYNTLGDNYLVKTDRMSMANSIEVRCPYLDYRFVEFVSRIPSEWKTNIFQGKIIMREIIKDMVPNKILNRKKQGFTPPVESWFKDKQFKDACKEYFGELNENGLISREWKGFYIDKVFKDNNAVYTRYKIRLFALHKWSKIWAVIK